ncbi:MAG: hypothetical protein ABUL48_00155 [Pseudorhodoplanes sp.]
MTLARRRRRSPIAICLPLLGCLNGDFGRVRQSLVIDDIHSWIGAEALIRNGGFPSEFPLTEDERLLRDLAYPLIAPPYDRPRWDSVLDHYGVTERFEPNWIPEIDNYLVALFAEPRRAANSLYAQLIDDIRNDIVRIGPFFAVARTVADLDSKRQKSLAYVTALAPPERENALARVAENALVVGWVRRSLEQRAAGYRFALERLVITVPSSMAVEAERQLTLLQLRIAQTRPVPLVAKAPAIRPLVTKD